MLFLIYLLIALGTFIEGELSLGVAMLAVVNGNLELVPVALAGALGAFLGDLFFLYLGSVWGDALLLRFPRVGSLLSKAGSSMKRYDRFAILLLRFQIGMRSAGCFSLGHAGQPPTRFALWDAPAALLWASVCCALYLPFLKLMGNLWQGLGLG